MANRYTLVPVQVLAMFSIPVFLSSALYGSRWKRIVALAIMATAASVQLLSIAMPGSLGDSQTIIHYENHVVVFQRLNNVIALASGVPGPEGLQSDIWRLNLFPSTLGHGSPVKLTLFWLAWAGIVSGAATCLRSAWTRVAHRSDDGARPAGPTRAEPPVA